MDEIYDSIKKSLIILKPYARVIKTGRKHLRIAFKELNFARKKAKHIKDKGDAENIIKLLMLARASMYDFIKESKKQGTDVKLFIYKAEEVIEVINIAILKCNAWIKSS